MTLLSRRGPGLLVADALHRCVKAAEATSERRAHHYCSQIHRLIPAYADLFRRLDAMGCPEVY